MGNILAKYVSPDVSPDVCPDVSPDVSHDKKIKDKFKEFISEVLEDINYRHTNLTPLSIRIININGEKKNLPQSEIECNILQHVTLETERIKKVFDSYILIKGEKIPIFESLESPSKSIGDYGACIYQGKLSCKYKKFILSLLNQHDMWWVTHPLFMQIPLEPHEIKNVKEWMGDPIFPRAQYDFNEHAIKECHIDKNYGDLNKENMKNIWLLTLTERNGKSNNVHDSGTEYMPIPCLNSRALEELQESFKINGGDLWIKSKKLDNSSNGTFLGKFLSALSVLFCDNHPQYWQVCQPGVLHNVASCYFHRSPMLLDRSLRFFREHFAHDESFCHILDNIKTLTHYD